MLAPARDGRRASFVQTQEAKASFMIRSKTAAALAAAGLLAIHPAAAHVIAGVRVFPVTLTFDDPGTADEVTLPQFVWQRDSGPENVYQWQWEWDKTITPNTAIIYNQGYDMLQAAGEKTRTGFENAVLTGKWQAYTNAEHEFVLSLGVSYEFNGGYATQNVDGDAYGGVSPTVYAGKGLGDLPIGVLRPLAITGELSYNISTRRLNSTLDNNGAPNSWEGGFSVQYSIPYLQSQVKDYALPNPSLTVPSGKEGFVSMLQARGRVLALRCRGGGGAIRPRRVRVRRRGYWAAVRRRPPGMPCPRHRSPACAG